MYWGILTLIKISKTKCENKMYTPSLLQTEVTGSYSVNVGATPTQWQRTTEYMEVPN